MYQSFQTMEGKYIPFEHIEIYPNQGLKVNFKYLKALEKFKMKCRTHKDLLDSQQLFLSIFVLQISQNFTMN